MQSSVKAGSTSTTIVTVFHKKDSISILSALWITYLHRDVTYKTCTYTSVLDSKTNTNSSTRILDFLHSRNIKTLQQQAFLPERLIKISKITKSPAFSLWQKFRRFSPQLFFFKLFKVPWRNKLLRLFTFGLVTWYLVVRSATGRRLGEIFFGILAARSFLRDVFIHHELRARNEKSRKKPEWLLDLTSFWGSFHDSMIHG